MIDRVAAADALEYTANLLTISAALIQMEEDFDARKKLYQVSAALTAAVAEADWGRFARTLSALTEPADPAEIAAAERARSLVIEFVQENPDLFPAPDKEPPN